MPVAELFVGVRKAVTLLLWALFIGTQALVFFMVSWLSTLLVQLGSPMDQALLALSLFHLGSFIVGLLAAWQSDQRSPELMLALIYLVAAGSLVLLAVGGVQGMALFPLCFLAGGGIVGASFCLGALAASYYPPPIRAMGFGWGLAVGRIGSITSPILGGLAIAAHWPVQSIFLTAVLPALICAVVVLILRTLRPRLIGMIAR